MVLWKNSCGTYNNNPTFLVTRSSVDLIIVL